MTTTPTIEHGLWVAPGIYLSPADLEDYAREADREAALRDMADEDAEAQWQYEQTLLGSYCHLD